MPSIGPVIIDLIGPELQQDEHELLQHPLVGGVILFSRHFQSPQQIAQLCQDIRNTRVQPLLIAVDHEGGRVQRFREGFTSLPPMGTIGQLFDDSQEQALNLAETCGWLMAKELLSVGIDLSFAPVLDLNKKMSPAIGDRSFHSDPQVVIALAKALIQGMHAGGMAATGKHFPGHGSVNVDSHFVLPVDKRCLSDIEKEDLIPFAALIQSLDAMMPAHILFPDVDDKPAGFSRVWLQTILREQLKFQGIIFSDDLNMKGADFAGQYVERAQAALHAGCDMVLICNNRPAALEILDGLPRDTYSVDSKKFEKICGKFSSESYESLKSSPLWQKKNELVKQFSTQETS